uniref:ADP-ribose pyrophosphatase n=1 Tax=Candidatus Kentrum sp. DK TaxID=2126562 RepID=A0A450S1W5_9GAMM|nr:MAG: ADP-ribose pyrophosphatase [Candidatus Kentron sp. DK]
MQYQHEILEETTCYQGFFRLARYRLRHALFGGGHSNVLTRERLERGHAAAVILHDPDADTLVMVEQFRIGAVGVLDNPWLLELVAGIIEEGETPEAVVRREAREEAGCEILGLEPVARFLLSPGGCSEEIHLFYGRVDARGAGGIHGCIDEGEDIRVRVITVEEGLRQLQEGAIVNATSIIGLQWLALRRR